MGIYTALPLLLVCAVVASGLRRNLLSADRVQFSEQFGFGSESGEEEVRNERRDNSVGYRVLTVCYKNGKVVTVNGEDCEQKIAVGKYRNAVNETG